MIIRAADVLAEGRRIAGLAGRVRRTPRLERGRATGSATRPPTTGTTRSPSTGSRTRERAFVRGHGRLAGPRTVEVDGEHVRGEARCRAQPRHGAGGAADRRAGGHAVLDQPRRPPDRVRARLAGRHRRRRRSVPSWPRRWRGSACGSRCSRSATGSSARRSPRRSAAGRGRVRAARASRCSPASRSARCRTTTAGSASPLDGQELDAEKLLVAAGRRPNLDDLGLETVGLDPSARSHRGRRADARRRGALGHRRRGRARARSRTCRCTSRPSACATSSARTARPPTTARVPHVTFTDPEVGSVGMTEKQARDAGLNVRVGAHRPRLVDPRLDRQGRGPDQAGRGRRPRRARRRHRGRAERRRDPLGC